MKRNFEKWLETFTDNISGYNYYLDFENIYKNVEKYKIELNILNSLIGSFNIKEEFIEILKSYPEVLKVIPILLAVRQTEVKILQKNGKKLKYDFLNKNYNEKQYAIFMEKTGLFELIQKHIINNLYDYVLGVEAGLNSNARKNRGGHIMENLVEKALEESGYIKNQNYFKEMYLNELEERFNLKLSNLNKNKYANKRFDFVVKTNSRVYAIEVNFYNTRGSKLNETARSYKNIAKEMEKIEGFKFIWFTDGQGWKSAKNNLKETFDIMPIYNINDIQKGIIKKFK